MSSKQDIARLFYFDVLKSEMIRTGRSTEKAWVNSDPIKFFDSVMCDDEFEKAVKISEYLANRFLQAELKR